MNQPTSLREAARDIPVADSADVLSCLLMQ